MPKETKKIKQSSQDKPQVIEAVKLSPSKSTPTNLHKEIEGGFQPKNGHYHVISLDANGNEIEGSDFSIAPKGFKRFYSDQTKFKVKKNPN